mgnify:CR=1 FL=1
MSKNEEDIDVNEINLFETTQESSTSSSSSRHSLVRHQSSSRYVLNLQIEEAKKLFKRLYNKIKNANSDDASVEECKKLVEPLITSSDLARKIRRSKITEDIDNSTIEEFPVHLACKKAYPKTLDLLFSLGGWSDLSDESDINGKTPIFYLFAPENIINNTKEDMEVRQKILITLFTLGVSIKREDKNNQNIFNYSFIKKKRIMACSSKKYLNVCTKKLQLNPLYFLKN